MKFFFQQSKQLYLNRFSRFQILALVSLVLMLFNLDLYSQSKISYSSPQKFTVGQAIEPLLPIMSSPRPYESGQTTSLFAGSGSAGYGDGKGSSAHFNNPLSTAVDQEGNVFVADAGNHRIRKISRDGVVTTLAGAGYPGYADGVGTSAVFRHPSSLVVDASGNVFVSDQQNHRIRKITPSGVVTTFAGSGIIGSSNGIGNGASFYFPMGLAFDASGNLYVSDSYNQKIRKVTPGGVVSDFAGTGAIGSTNGPALSSTFKYPMGLAFDAIGNLFIADRSNNMIRKISAAGIVTTYAGNGSIGSADGTGTSATFKNVNSIVVNQEGTVYVADQQNNMIRRIDIYGNVFRFAGNLEPGSQDGVGGAVSLNSPYGLSMDNKKNIYIAENAGNRIRKMETAIFKISPNLPVGLEFDINTGKISGTPTVATPSTVYTIKSYNTSDINYQCLITIAIDASPGLQGSQDQNYVVTSTIKKGGVKDLSQLQNLTANEINHTVSYFDGLGRISQVIKVKGSPLLNDIVQPIAFDEFGREAVSYEAYAEQSGDGSYRKQALVRQAQYYSNLGWDANVTKTSAPYSMTVYEPSPLNRVKEQGAVGTVWQPAASRSNVSGRTVLVEYLTNDISTLYGTSGYGVRRWISTPVSNTSHLRTLTSNGLYPAGQLFLKVSKGANWVPQDGKIGTIEEYIDKEGRTILKRKFNSSTTVLSTYYVYDDLGNLNFILSPVTNPDEGNISQVLLDQYCSQFRYDDKSRLIEKRIPSTDGWSTVTYNLLDQVVIKQDTLQRLNKKASFNKYDGLGRLIMTGTLNNYTETRFVGQNRLNSGANSNWEDRDTGLPHGYSSNSFPAINANTEVETVNYYDDYDILGIPNNLSASFSNMTQGLLTASKVKILGTLDYLWTINYYNEERLLVKQYKQHYLGGVVNSLNYDEIEFTYNFAGELKSSKRFHSTLSRGSVVIVNRYDYDHLGRRLRTYEKINADNEILLGENRYNEIGQLSQKKLHNGNQVNNYSYNERGWLKSKSSPQFSLELKYENGTTPLFDGNISEQLWNSGNRMIYSYDKLGRLTSGVGAGMSEYVTYDNVGNIKQLTRDGVIRNYVYDGNRLKSTSVGSGENSYQYDANGNIKFDGRLGQSITINSLNLPSEIPGLGVRYIYDADGNKLRKITSSLTTDYIDGVTYKNGNLEFIQTEAGIARKNGPSYSYEYNLTDHLGNVRYTFYNNPAGQAQNVERLQSDDYYPFGVRKSGLPVSLNNHYLYGGKEIQDETSNYDYGARIYDPVIGRWCSLDPANQFDDVTPYAGMANNPILYADPDGRIIPLLAIGVGALVGGGINLGVKLLNGKVHSFGDGLMAFGIGAVAGGVGVATGGAAIAAAGASGISAASVVGGVIMGATGSAVSASIQGMGNAIYFGDPFSAEAIGTSTLLGGLTGGVMGAFSAPSGSNIWTGRGQVNPGQVTMVEFAGRSVKQATNEVTADGAVWSQKTFGATFSKEGKFAGKTIDQVVSALKDKQLFVTDLPIDVIVRNGQTFILNTRSSVALIQAGIPRSAWNLVNQTGVSFYETLLTEQLTRNGLTNGINTIRQSGTNIKFSH